MGYSAAAFVVGNLIASQNQPKAPQVPAAPQASQAPDAAGQRSAMAGTGQAGGSPGVAQTFLTGNGGVDPSLLQLGKNTLLGGGSPTGGPTGMGSMG